MVAANRYHIERFASRTQENHWYLGYHEIREPVK